MYPRLIIYVQMGGGSSRKSTLEYSISFVLSETLGTRAVRIQGPQRDSAKSILPFLQQVIAFKKKLVDCAVLVM